MPTESNLALSKLPIYGERVAHLGTCSKCDDANKPCVCAQGCPECKGVGWFPTGICNYCDGSGNRFGIGPCRPEPEAWS